MFLLKVCKINDYPYKFNVIVHSWASCVSYDNTRIHKWASDLWRYNLKKKSLIGKHTTSITFVPDIRRTLFTPLKKKFFVLSLWKYHDIFYKISVRDKVKFKIIIK